MKVKELIKELKKCNPESSVELEFIGYEEMTSSIEPLFDLSEREGKFVYLRTEDASAQYD